MPIRKKSRSAYHHGDLRNAAVGAAMAHIAKSGDTAFTLRQLAAMLRVSSAALYRHFPSKLAILAAIAEAGFTELARLAQAHEALAEQDPIKALARQGMDYVSLARETPATFRVMFHAELTDLDAFPTLRAARDASYAALHEAVARCARRGLLRASLTVDDVALAMWAAAHGTASLLVDKQLGASVPPFQDNASDVDLAGKLLGMLGHGMFVGPLADEATAGTNAPLPVKRGAV